MNIIYLVRHAESEANAGKVFPSSHMVRITELGKKQAESLVEIFEEPKRIIVSKFLRTIETAEPVINKFKDAAVHTWMDTHEFVSIDNKIREITEHDELLEIEQKYWEENDPYRKDSHATENFAEFIERVFSLIEKMKKLDGINYVISHGYVIRMLKIILKRYNGVFLENKERMGDLVFYKKIMKEFSDFYVDGNEQHTKNAEVIDFTDLVMGFRA